MGACGSAPAERRTSKVDPETVVNGEPQESSKPPAVDPTPSSGSAAGGHTQTQDSSSSERKEEQSREHDTKKEPEQESKKEGLVIKTEPEASAAAPSTADDAAASPEVSHKQDATADSEPTVKKSKKSRKDKREKKDKRRKKDKKDKHKQRHDQDGTSISSDKQIRTQTDQSVGRAGEIGDEEDSASHSTGGSNSTGDSNSTADSKPVTSSWDDSDDDDDAQRYNRNKSIDVSNVVLVPKEDISGVKGFGGTRCTIGGRELDGKLTHKLKCARCGYRVYRFPGRRWATDVDYFWVRNYALDDRAPAKMIEDQAKLQAKLEPSDTAAAYACGCTWQTVSQAKDITVDATDAAPEGGISEGRMRWKVE